MKPLGKILPGGLKLTQTPYGLANDALRRLLREVHR